MSVSQEVIVLGRMNFRTYEEFWGHCMHFCRDYKCGCAKTCLDRKRLRIPPHGERYVFYGEVKAN